MKITDKARKIDRKDIRQIESHWYQVRSQSLAYESWYDVIHTENGFKCDCPYYHLNHDNCKHILAIEMHYFVGIPKTTTLPDRANTIKTIKPQLAFCSSCGSNKIFKSGMRHNKKHSIQRYQCKECGVRFSENLGFEGMHATPEIITSTMQLYFTGESYRNITKYLRLQGQIFSYSSIYNWIRKYTNLLESYIGMIRPVVGTKWHADEAWVKVSGKQKYMFAMMDNKTRFWLAQEVANSKFKHNAKSLLKMGRDVAGITPTEFVTDGLPAYHDAFKKVFQSKKNKDRVKHTNEIHIRHQVKNNNIQERLNGEFRDREKVYRGLKKDISPAFKGYQIYHNYLRPHMGLGGLTPAEMAGIEVHGDNKWKTLIQNARLHNVRK